MTAIRIKDAQLFINGEPAGTLSEMSYEFVGADMGIESEPVGHVTCGGYVYSVSRVGTAELKRMRKRAKRLAEKQARQRKRVMRATGRHG